MNSQTDFNDRHVIGYTMAILTPMILAFAIFFYPFDRNFQYPRLMLISLLVSHIVMCILCSGETIIVGTVVEQALLAYGVYFINLEDKKD